MHYPVSNQFTLRLEALHTVASRTSLNRTKQRFSRPHVIHLSDGGRRRDVWPLSLPTVLICGLRGSLEVDSGVSLVIWQICDSQSLPLSAMKFALLS
jgi:hypothetical protein